VRSPDVGDSCALDGAAGRRVGVAFGGDAAASSHVDSGFPGDDATVSPIGVGCRRRSAAFAVDDGALPIVDATRDGADVVSAGAASPSSDDGAGFPRPPLMF
jgi:hypothetical protein